VNHLPAGYVAREAHSDYLDIPTMIEYQPDVYALAGFLAGRMGAGWIIDVGCGSGQKLRTFAQTHRIMCIDRPEAIEVTKACLGDAIYVEWDLEYGLPSIDDEILGNAVVICADVIEHLQTPTTLAAALARISRVAPFVLISTPDRERARGWLDFGPPANHCHVMEWSAGEFMRFLGDAGFAGLEIHGHTVNTDLHRAKTTTLVVSGTHASRPAHGGNLRVAAIMHVYNEVDILEEVARHLQAEGIELHLFDNWSSDGTWELANRLLTDGVAKSAMRFPEAPSVDYEWARMLGWTEEYARRLDADWVMHHDADEIRCSPWPGVRLLDAVNRVDQLGFDALDFTVMDFRFLSSRPAVSAPYAQSLNFFEFGRRPGHFRQIKAWKNCCRVNLADSGGHDASFAGRRVFPIKFLTKHYPLRSFEQARRKVFRDRIPRMRREQQSLGWHTQYDDFVASGEISGWSLNELIAWHPHLFHTEYVVERISGIGIAGG